MGNRFPRLKARADFLRVAAARRKWVAPGLLLQVAPGADPDRRAIGFTASRKVGNAVHRNRARRRLRAAVDTVMAAHAAAGHDYVLVAREATVARPWTDLVGDLETALKRLKVWREPPPPGSGP